MKITQSTAKHLAELSSLSLSDQELETLTVDLDNIVNYIGELSDLDTAGVEPTYQVTGLSNVWREDEIGNHLSREKLLDLAPASRDNQVEVPQVL